MFIELSIVPMVVSSMVSRSERSILAALSFTVMLIYFPYYLLPTAQGVTPIKTSPVYLGKVIDPANITNTTATGMSSQYITHTYTGVLGPSNKTKIAFIHAGNLKVDTFGGWFVYAVWQEKSGSNTQIFFARSVDGGKTWTPPENLTSPRAEASNPQLGAFADEVYVTWEQKNPNNNDIFLVKSIDGGSAFAKPINLSQTASTSNATDSSITVDKATGKVIIAWAAGNYGYVRCSRC
jgi:hypothetical protein